MARFSRHPGMSPKAVIQLAARIGYVIDDGSRTLHQLLADSCTDMYRHEHQRRQAS